MLILAVQLGMVFKIDWMLSHRRSLNTFQRAKLLHHVVFDQIANTIYLAVDQCTLKYCLKKVTMAILKYIYLKKNEHTKFVESI